jgi:hypothetical protein
MALRHGVENSRLDKFMFRHILLTIITSVFATESCDAVACNHNSTQDLKNCGGQETLIDYL